MFLAFTCMIHRYYTRVLTQIKTGRISIIVIIRDHGKKSSNFDIVFSLYIRGKRTISLPFPTQNAFYTSNFPPSFPTGKLRVKEIYFYPQFPE